MFKIKKINKKEEKASKNLEKDLKEAFKIGNEETMNLVLKFLME